MYLLADTPSRNHKQQQDGSIKVAQCDQCFRCIIYISTQSFIILSLLVLTFNIFFSKFEVQKLFNIVRTRHLFACKFYTRHGVQKMIWEIRLVLNKPGILTHGSIFMPEGEDVNMQTVLLAEEDAVVVPLGGFLPEEPLGVLGTPAVRGSQEPLDVRHV